jgi:hypothetical protein
VPAPADTTANGSTTTTKATDATEASTYQALLTRSTHPEGHKHHCRRNPTARRAEFRVEPDSVRCYPSVGDSPRGPLKQWGKPHLKPATKPKHVKPNHAGA